MLRTLESGQSARLKDYLTEVGFTPQGVEQRIQTDVLAGRHKENLSLLLYRTRELDALNILIRWFIVDEPFRSILDCHGHVSPPGRRRLPGRRTDD